MDVPYSQEIRSLRLRLSESERARAELQGLEPVLSALSLGHGAESAELRVTRLRASWPELDIDGDTFEALGKARTALRRVVARGDSAGRELHALVEKQWNALDAPEWHEVRGEVLELSSELAALSASYGPTQRALAMARPLLEAMNKQVARAEAEPDHPKSKAQVLATLEAARPVLALSDLGSVVPAVDPNASNEVVLAVLTESVADLARAIHAMHHDNAELTAQIAALKARIEATMG